MTRQRDERLINLWRQLEPLGVQVEEMFDLLTLSRTLSSWDTRECNGEIERDDDSGNTYRVIRMRIHGLARDRREPIPDRASAALVRASDLAGRHGLTAYHQGDPRGCSLYLLRPGDVREGENVHAVYAGRGIAVCVD
jgi:hypothetical protein